MELKDSMEGAMLLFAWLFPTDEEQPPVSL